MVELNARSQTQLMSLIRVLDATYPDASSELNFTNDYQLLVAVILSAQCTDKKVNEVTPALFEQFPDFCSLSRARLSQMEKIIRPVNYYRTKSKHLISMAQLVVNDFSGKLPRDYASLRLLPGVGNKTANVVLGELGAAHTLPVDTHVFRVAHRLGLSSGRTPEQVETDLKGLFDAHIWRSLHHWLILHGRRVCKSLNPQCTSCPLAPHCPSKQLFLRSKVQPPKSSPRRRSAGRSVRSR